MSSSVSQPGRLDPSVGAVNEQEVNGVDIVRSLPNDEYHAHPNFGSTILKWLKESFSNRHRNKTLSSQGISDGRHWHDLLDLGPEEFGRRAVVVPDEYCLASGSVSTKKDAKEWLASLPADAIPLTGKTSDLLGRMLDHFQQNSASWEIYSNLKEQEVSVFWDWMDVPVKVRPDAITHCGRLIDWKSTSDPDPKRQFGRAVERYGYGLSAALYEEGCRVAGLCDSDMVFVVSSTTSYETQVMRLPPAYLAKCRDDLMLLLEQIAEREQSNNWLPEGYGEVIEIPMWGYSNNSNWFRAE